MNLRIKQRRRCEIESLDERILPSGFGYGMISASAHAAEIRSLDVSIPSHPSSPSTPTQSSPTTPTNSSPSTYGSPFGSHPTATNHPSLNSIPKRAWSHIPANARERIANAQAIFALKQGQFAERSLNQSVANLNRGVAALERTIATIALRNPNASNGAQQSLNHAVANLNRAASMVESASSNPHLPTTSTSGAVSGTTVAQTSIQNAINYLGSLSGKISSSQLTTIQNSLQTAITQLQQNGSSKA